MNFSSYGSRPEAIIYYLEEVVAAGGATDQPLGEFRVVATAS